MADNHAFRGHDRVIPPGSNLGTVKLMGRKKGQDDDLEGSAGVTADIDAATSADTGSRRTGPKGRPTPKRSEARRNPRKGHVAPAPMTAAEARARRKSLAGPKLSREERRAERTASRARMTDRRERMLAGDEGYLLPRDQGPIKRYVRDVVDSRRNLLGLFMPATMLLLFASFGVAQLQFYASPAMLVLMVVMGVDGVLLARKVSKLVDAKFPDNTESRWKLGIYAAGRASQLRRMRAPRPQVERGSSVD
ncbi:membrane protein [Mycobacterium terramassiliense]|uniref:Membrane protein n=1 Tax=Mycobacterium terramassiliense TaxID=1841859 RepID=A0A2U3NKM3_9MYCO|nr:membrane protein [Mycobacterium terramassiliense]